ncbi:site-specific DNA-methyltransferase [Bosea robiniae]|uniref:site-specific DNA-methyltransferase (adenine-specific) n=1 Tax=Bosea robiniae TaxID=1036780 RepID=A0ABY0P1H3_9HYPH|nr:DNA methyltransferase [Bosea robiniae]SDG74256.1 DNA modification methylase [Bosea robiniae]
MNSPHDPPKPQARVRRRVQPDIPPTIKDPALERAIASFAPQVSERDLNELVPSARNARTHSKKQIHLIAESIKAFGFVSPILATTAGEIVAGHGRYEAAKLLGLEKVRVIYIDHLGPQQIRALRITDNRLAELSGWDDEILKLELGELIDLDFEVEITGFETAQIDVILDGNAPVPVKADPADALPELQDAAVTQRGDLWLLGENRILCGDARAPEDYQTLLGGELAQMVFTDPPYNVRVDGHVSGLGRTKHREFAMASGEMSKLEFTGFLHEVFARIAEASQEGALIYSCIDGPHLHEMLNAGYGAFDELKSVITWAKANAGMGSLYRSQTELITLWKTGKAPHINNIELGKHGRYRTTLWSYAGVNGFRKGRMAELASHPTVKPCAMVMDAIKDCSKPKGIILDSFSGSGTTLIAAAKTKRRGYVMELDPLYVDGAIRRWEKLFKDEARHAETGLTFAEMAAQRGGDASARALPHQSVGGGHVA